METSILRCILAVMIFLCGFSCGMPSALHDQRVRSLIDEDEVDGYDVATVLAVDTVTREETGQSKRDVERVATGPSLKNYNFTLMMGSGLRMRLSLHRKGLDRLATRFTELTEDGKTETVHPELDDCFFVGSLEGQDSVVSVTLCNGEMIGSVTTDTHTYEINTLPAESAKNESSDDVIRVLVTWQSIDHGSMTSEDLMTRRYVNDGLEIPERKFSGFSTFMGRGKDKTSRRNLSNRKVTVEIANIVDKYYIAELKRKYSVTTNSEIIKHIYQKWNGVAQVLSNKARAGWDITLKVVEIQIWRKDPSLYVTTSNDKIGERMKMACRETSKGKYDQVTLHTAKTSDPKRVGLAWIGGVCRPNWRCAASRRLQTDHGVELHELGHSLGLNHDGKMAVCTGDSEQKNGFMGGDKNHFRKCYKIVFDKTFTNIKKNCVFRFDNPNTGREFP